MYMKCDKTRRLYYAKLHLPHIEMYTKSVTTRSRLYQAETLVSLVEICAKGGGRHDHVIKLSTHVG